MPNKRPKALTVMRWVLVFSWTGVVLIAGPNLGIPSPLGSVLGFAVLSIVLVNALWQHMPLASACIMAAILAGLVGVAYEALAFLAFDYALSPGDWLANAVGAVAGAATGYPLIKKVDELVSPTWEHPAG